MKRQKSLDYLVVAAALVASGCQRSTPVDGAAAGYAAEVFSSYPGTTIRFYDVDGRDEESIRKSLDAFGPKDSNDGSNGDGHTTWNANWYWHDDANGQCDLQHLQYRFEIVVTLPHLVDETRLPPTLRKEWGDYMAALINHELGHVQHAYQHSRDIVDAVKSSGCDGANAAGNAKINELLAFDRDYDAATKHGATQGAVFPT